MRGTVELLANPFNRGQEIVIPAGTEFISMAPNVDGVQTTKRAKRIAVHNTTQSYTFDYDAFEAQVSAAGVGGYWNYYTVTDAVVEANGLIPEYKTHKIIL